MKCDLAILIVKVKASIAQDTYQNKISIHLIARRDETIQQNIRAALPYLRIRFKFAELSVHIVKGFVEIYIRLRVYIRSYLCIYHTVDTYD